MNQHSTANRLSQVYAPPDGSPIESAIISAVFRLFDSIEIDSSRLTQLYSSFTVENFQLGDEIAAFNFNQTSNFIATSAHSEQENSKFYVICQGRVRLLCRGADQRREATAQLLEADEPFGADPLLSQTALPYRAIAASAVQVVSIPASLLAAWLNEFPELRKQLQQQAQQRERLIFFKSLTHLRSTTTQKLAQFAALLEPQTIEPNTALAEVALSHAGRFWLRSGQIQDQNHRDRSPSIGESWGHPAPTPASWTAETRLLIYRLPSAQWDAAIALIPTLLDPAPENSPDAQTAAQGKYIPLTPDRSSARPAAASLPREPVAPTASETLPRRKPQPQDILFPKPVNRRLLDALHRYPWIEQQSSSDCGAACLGMVARYWGKRFPIHVLRELANVNRAGASLKSLAKAADVLGFQARPVRASLGRLANQPNPWIAHWEGSHFVVVYQVRGNRVIIADPAIGRRSMSQREFQNHWTGYALLLDPTERLRSTDIKQASLSRYLNVLLPYRTTILQVILLSVLIQLFGLITPLFTQIILDKVVVQKSLNVLNVFAIGLLLFGIWSIALSSVRQYLLVYFSNRLDLTLISGFISHTLTLPLKFFESRRVGDIITRVQENQKIQQFLVQQVVLAWLNVLTGFIYLGLMLYYNWKLTLLVLALIPPIVLLTLGATPFLRQVSREIFKEAADQNSVLVEMMTGVATVKSAAAEREMRWRWEDHLTSQMNALFRGQKLGINLQATSGLINTVGGTALLWYGASLVIQDQLTIGQFVAFNMMIGYVISPVLVLVNLWDDLQEVVISVERLNDVFEATPEETAEQSLLVLPALRGSVEFENVTFRYGEDEDQNTLQNLSFSVQAGQTIALVGRSGSGKTTLIKLLQGLYHPNRGRVLIDGYELRHVSPQSLRSQLGIVPQECFLFSGTILENITLYRPEFSLEEVVEVSKLAEAHAFIQSLPLGYSTKVGERGSSLSGGQRQRIAIARALLGDPRILILDEATSSLDTESERRFQRNLAQIRRDRTTFVIAHRLSTVRNADRILVVDRGILVEQGTHEELMALHGLYCHLAQQQLDL